jgi:UPF0271 protein
MAVRLNIDLGELPDEPDALAALAQMVNVACGAHAGDAEIAARTLRNALAHGAQAGAHPSFPDRENFGRVAMELDDGALRATLDAQLGWLRSIASSVGVALAHVKPHGALYHAADRDERVARALIDRTRAMLGEVALVGPPGGAMESCARSVGVAFLREGFADRGYDATGALIPRGSPGALLHDTDTVRAQVERLVASGRFDTLCVHGDGPDAVRLAGVVREALG